MALDWGGAGMGAVSGATMGGLYGSAVPGIGTAIGAGIGMVGGGIAGLFSGGGGEKEQKDDPLAPIRQQLMGLAAGVPAMVEARKKQIGEMYGAAKEEGLADIGEDVRGRRGWGPSSIETRLGTELREKLGRGQAGAELGAEEWGLSAQMRALTGAGGMPFPAEEEEEPGFLSQLLGMGGELAGQELGFNRLKEFFQPEDDIQTTIAKQKPTLTATDWKPELGLRPEASYLRR